MKKFNGFTLAEVLITLGIIGVVAAITLPTLIKNYQKHVWVNQLKKSVSIVEQGFKLAMADDEVMELENTKLMQSLGNGDIAKVDATTFNNFISEFKKYFKVISAEQTYEPSIDYKTLDGGSSGEVKGDFSKIVLADGNILFISGRLGKISKKSEAECEQIKQLGGSTCSLFGGSIEIEVNGNKGPNQFGRDRFEFRLGNNGLLYPESGKDNALYNIQEDLSSNDSYWKNDDIMCDTKSSFSIGIGCAARIMENGWKMDY